MSLETQLFKDSAIDFAEGIGNLITGIKKDYADWMTSEDMIERFNKGINIRTGKKYTKVICGSSVWGFIANTDGTHKGIPHKKGDVFKAAGWAAPAKWARGSIFDTNTNWFSWTGPNYL
tara:strand:- start:701 stop:1057 length:357 start_codon:yes stop_codon:yes gene_type:complete